MNSRPFLSSLDQTRVATRKTKNSHTAPKRALAGYIKINDLKNIERLKRDLFEDLGPVSKNQFYFVGEMGED
jgi:hypothetical protein